MRLTRLFCSALVVLGTAGTSSADGLSAEVLVELARLSEPALSPDETLLVYTLRETDLDTNRGRTDLWARRLDDGDSAPWRLTTNAANDSSAQFSKDGRYIYFLSDRAQSRQVYRLHTGGGDAEPVTDLPIAVDGFALTPDNKRLVLALATIKDCNIDFDCTATASENTSRVRRYSALLVRHWDQWREQRVGGLFAFGLDKDGLPNGKKPVELTADFDGDVPMRPFGSLADSVSIAPDSATLVFSAKQRSADEAWSTNADLFEVRLSGSRLSNITAENAAADTAPQHLANGELVWTAMSRPGYESDRRRILHRAKSGKVKTLAANWDRSPDTLVPAADGQRLYALALDEGRRRLFELALDAALPTPRTAFGWVSAVVPSTSGPIVALDSFHQPVDLYRIGKLDNAVYRLTDVNAERLSETRFGVYEQFSFSGWNDETVHGFVMRPPGHDGTRKVPVAFLIHGGPQGSFADHFSYRWNPQTYAALGYAVVMIDFHGSTGYGQDFTDSIRGDWGGKPLDDLKLGLAAALERYPWLDGDAVCALGASYGGYMVNWIAGNWPERFQCLVNHDGIFDNRMMAYATEELWFVEWEHGGPYTQAAAGHERHNPVNHVAAWQTPMLVIHGEKDFRIPLTQGLATFTALQRRGIDSELVVFTDENHWVLSPAGSLTWHQSVAAWLERFLK